MVFQKKKLAFYSILSSGHFNVCASLAVAILNRFSDRIEVYFIVDAKWKAHLEKIDSRFKFGVFEYDQKDGDQRLVEVVNKLEATLTMDVLEKAKTTWSLFVKDPTLIEVDAKSEQQIKKIKPDFLLCDQAANLPAMVNSGCRRGFIVSLNPLVLDFDGFPNVMSGAGMDESDKIKQFDCDLAPFMSDIHDYLHEFFERRNSKFEHPDFQIHQVRSDDFIIYSFPKEIDYFSEELKEKYKLWQIDTPLFPARIPKPYKLPEKFAALPGKIIYLSLGSLFSAYTHRLQKFVDILEKLPNYKYIVSKGPNGDKLVIPSERFIGENYINQLGVLQVADAMIAHGGNNTLGECFYFGVPTIIAPVVGDQMANAKRVEETGYGFAIDIIGFTQEELAEKLHKLVSDQALRKRWKEASMRIQKENRTVAIAERVVEYIEKL